MSIHDISEIIKIQFYVVFFRANERLAVGYTVYSILMMSHILLFLFTVTSMCFWQVLHFCKERLAISRPQPGRHALTKLTLAVNNLIIPVQEEFG
jgi:hypothetical protein